MRRMPWLKRFTTTVYNPSEVLRTLQFVTTVTIVLNSLESESKKHTKSVKNLMSHDVCFTVVDVKHCIVSLKLTSPLLEDPSL